MPKATIEVAKKIEALLDEVISLAEGNEIIPTTFLATIKVARRNAVNRFYNEADKKKEAK